ncbi:pyrroline-5-carboxylate reductase [Melittangium boletus]|uniref:Pyrroline-5-carboxylate reductase n=1 Tax=Melittangium boletus DSM 14713 TaxID=1294270 RepID=A0A286SGC3_9BACT|nr:pyrroline-5-carboxylate reductase [Melittangium boletus]ATB26638.1 pyrroline-5-carboxylate reductase [Melittangium boletus DSM 14713]
MLERTIAFLGAGNMAEALIKGLLRAGTARPEALIATGRRDDRLDTLRRTYGVRTTLDNLAAVREADVVVLSVKPQALDKVLVQVAPAVDANKLFISVAAGVPISAMERRLGGGTRIIRTMPNTPSLVGAGACALSPGEHASEEDLSVASRVFQSVGTTTVVDENLLDAVTGLSGSGPAYIFLIIEALSDAGVKVGLPRYTALKLAAQTVLGSAQLLIETNAHPGQLKDQVTSPGGTAIAGLHTLEAGGLRTTLINAVEAATRRARELGEQFLEKSQG